MTDPIVVDLSHHNPTPDWAKLKASGVVGVIHKATEGTSYVDDQLFKRARAAMDAGLKWSTYHFLRDSDPEQQMAFYLDTVDPVEGERVCIDHEDENVTLEQLKDCITYIRDHRPDLQIAVYSGHLIKDQLPDTVRDEILADTSLWIAHYTGDDEPTWPTATWPTWSLWQYTDSAKVAGISQPVDGDRWNGDEAALLKWFGPAVEPAPPVPKPPPEVPTITADVTVVGDVDFQLVVNGVLVWETD
jgi:GH25 family lysozyme M1 (1,4-beta-N-acetylmuramidase)